MTDQPHHFFTTAKRDETFTQWMLREYNGCMAMHAVSHYQANGFRQMMPEYTARAIEYQELAATWYNRAMIARQLYSAYIDAANR